MNGLTEGRWLQRDGILQEENMRNHSQYRD